MRTLHAGLRRASSNTSPRPSKAFGMIDHFVKSRTAAKRTYHFVDDRETVENIYHLSKAFHLAGRILLRLCLYYSVRTILVSSTISKEIEAFRLFSQNLVF